MREQDDDPVKSEDVQVDEEEDQRPADLPLLVLGAPLACRGTVDQRHLVFGHRLRLTVGFIGGGHRKCKSAGSLLQFGAHSIEMRSSPGAKRSFRNNWPVMEMR